MQVYGILEKAQLENVAGDLSNTLSGLIWFDTAINKIKFYNGAIRSVVDEDSTQTLTNKTITGGVFDVLNLTEQGSTPATPSSGTKKFYAKNDGKIYSLDSNGNEVEVGSGGSGSGVNFYELGDFETAQTSDFTVSAGTLSFTTVVGEVGNGTKSFKFVPNASGDTVETSNFALPLGYRKNGRLFLNLRVKCADDLIIRLKDKTNVNNIIEETISANTAYTGVEFSDALTADEDNLCENLSWEIESTGTGDIFIDDIGVSPTGSYWNAQISDKTQWRHINQNTDDMLSTASSLRFDLGGAFSENINEGASLVTMTDDSGNSRTTFVANQECHVVINVSGNHSIEGGRLIMYHHDSSDTFISRIDGSQTMVNTGIVTLGFNVRMEAGDYLYMNESGSGALTANQPFRLSYTAKASSEDIITNSDNVAPSKVFNNVTTAISTNSKHFIGFSDSEFDDDNNLVNVGSASNNTDHLTTTHFKAPKTGYYWANCRIYSVDLDLDINETFRVQLDYNGSGQNINEEEIQYTGSSPKYSRATSGLFRLNKGDTLSVAAYHECGADINLSNNGKRSWFEVIRLDKSPLVGLGNETCVLSDIKNGVDGGSSVAGIQVRDLNTIDGYTSFCSLSSNQFTLQHGTYLLRGLTPNYRGNFHRAILYNVDTASDMKRGTIVASDSSTNVSVASEVTHYFKITEPTTFELRHNIQAAKVNDGLGLGAPSGFSGDATFSTVEITKLK